MSKEKTPVLSGVVPAFEVMMTALERLADQNPRLKKYTDVALLYIVKYYSRVDRSPAYTIAMCSSRFTFSILFLMILISFESNRKAWVDPGQLGTTVH